MSTLAKITEAELDQLRADLRAAQIDAKRFRTALLAEESVHSSTQAESRKRGVENANLRAAVERLTTNCTQLQESYRYHEARAERVEAELAKKRARSGPAWKKKIDTPGIWIRTVCGRLEVYEVPATFMINQSVGGIKWEDDVREWLGKFFGPVSQPGMNTGPASVGVVATATSGDAGSNPAGAKLP